MATNSTSQSESDQARARVASYLALGYGLRPLHELTGVQRNLLAAFAKGEGSSITRQQIARINAIGEPDLTATEQQVATLQEALLETGYPEDLVSGWLQAPVSWEQLCFIYKETGLDVGPQGRVLSSAIPPEIREQALEFAAQLEDAFGALA